jgi:hypothetical protein
MSRSAFLLVLLLALGAAQTPIPSIQNGRVETRQTSALDRDIAAAAAGSVDPVWVGWRVPIVEGQRGGCCTYVDDWNSVRGCFVESSSNALVRQIPQITPPAAVPIEAGSGLVMLLRVVDARVERLRTLGDDCPLDAGGRTVYWLQGVTTANSIKFLEGLLRPNTGMNPAQEQRLSSEALSAIALHRDPAADAILDRLASATTESSLRRAARSSLGSTRGAHGFDMLRQLIDAERLPDIRRQLISALGQTRQPGTADALLAIARRDTDAKARAEAVYWLPQRGGQRVIADVTGIIDSDTSDEVRQRAVKGLARLPADDSIPLLLQLARTNKSPIVKKEAVTALGQSKDPRAIAYLEELLK